jgi:hypothetical protein
MTIVLTEEPMAALPEYARVPVIFTVDRVLDVTSRDDGRGGFALSERRLEAPYEKDYDAIAGEGPLQWGRRFDLSTWAQLHGCRQLKIETQDTNARACRFYERQGCRLETIHRAAYPELPEEIQLLWYKDLPR